MADAITPYTLALPEKTLSGYSATVSNRFVSEIPTRVGQQNALGERITVDKAEIDANKTAIDDLFATEVPTTVEEAAQVAADAVEADIDTKISDALEAVGIGVFETAVDAATLEAFKHYYITPSHTYTIPDLLDGEWIHFIPIGNVQVNRVTLIHTIPIHEGSSPFFYNFGVSMRLRGTSNSTMRF